MSEPEIVDSKELTAIFTRAIEDREEGVMSHLRRGKWHLVKILFKSLTPEAIQIEVLPEPNIPAVNMEIHQPVGITFQQDYCKYVFESTVTGFETSVNNSSRGRILLELPYKMERMQRRAYNRVPVPENMNVNVVFWHRGYTDDTQEVPLENSWQGKLENLSVGGAQVSVDSEHKPNFKIRQVLGLQFTPMSYSQPILVEAQVIHFQESTDSQMITIGLEFLGLEARGQARETLHRIRDIVEVYEKENARMFKQAAR